MPLLLLRGTLIHRCCRMYIRESDLAQQLNRSVRTLQRVAARRLGPLRIKVGRLVFYRIDSVRTWLAQQERKFPVKV
jgi:hypothetical protein